MVCLWFMLWFVTLRLPFARCHIYLPKFHKEGILRETQDFMFPTTQSHARLYLQIDGIKNVICVFYWRCKVFFLDSPSIKSIEHVCWKNVVNFVVLWRKWRSQDWSISSFVTKLTQFCRKENFSQSYNLLLLSRIFKLKNHESHRKFINSTNF